MASTEIGGVLAIILQPQSVGRFLLLPERIKLHDEEGHSLIYNRGDACAQSYSCVCSDLLLMDPWYRNTLCLG